MITKILQSSKSFAAIRYNEDKVVEGVAELLELKNIPDFIKYNFNSCEDKTKFMMDYSAKNDRVKYPQFHVAISCEGLTWTKEQLLDFAHQWLAKMGYQDNPALIYYHHDTDNNHLHIVTSRVGVDGRKINHNFEKTRSQRAIHEILGEHPRQDATEFLQKALYYRYASVNQFRAICEVNGYECYEQDDNFYLKKDGAVQAFLSMQAIMKGQRHPGEDYYKRRSQLKAIMNKYLLTTASLEEFTDLMRKQHGLMFKFIGDKDKPRAYFIVDNATQTVFKGSDVVKIADVLDFEPLEDKLKGLTTYIYQKLEDNHDLTTAEINKMIKRYMMGAYISKGNVIYQGRVVQELSDAQKKILKVNDRNNWYAQFSAATREEKQHLADFFHVDVKLFEKSKDDIVGPADLRNKLNSLCEFAENSKDFHDKMKSAGLNLKLSGDTLFAIDFETKTCMNVDAFAPKAAKVIREYMSTKRGEGRKLSEDFTRKYKPTRNTRVINVRNVSNVAQTLSSAGTGAATTAFSLASAALSRLNQRGSGGVGGGGTPRKKKRLYDDDDDEMRMGR